MTQFTGLGEEISEVHPEWILDSIADGVYVTDLNRRIVFWNKAAEDITGWQREDVIGQSCWDQVLCHVDKDNRSLCGEDTCPLHRAIYTGSSVSVPVIIFAKGGSGQQIPMQVNVAPVRNQNNEVIGGVEVFRDMSETIQDLTRAKKIQEGALKFKVENASKLAISVHYIPYDMVGGDYYAVEQLSDDIYIFMLADIMGHGTSAALYTMYLRSLWEENSTLFPDVSGFMSKINQDLFQLFKGDHSFAAAICGVIDLSKHQVTLAGGASPAPFLFKRGQKSQKINLSGLALGMVKVTTPATQIFDFNPGDVLFTYTDGAIEVTDNQKKLLDDSGLQRILEQTGYPECPVSHQQIEEEIIQYSGGVRLNDDVTFLEFRWQE